MSHFTDSHFQLYSRYIYNRFGMQISRQKKSLLFLKVDKAMKSTGLKSYDDYYTLLSNSNNEEIIRHFANIITTNTTEFFREKDHFYFLQEQFDDIAANNPRILEAKELRVWSAGCSTGQEPYTLAMILKERLGDAIDIKILATDLNDQVLSIANEGIYQEAVRLEMPQHYFNTYFEHVDDGYRVIDEVRKLITFRTFNLVDDFHFKKGFDIIFCRNVMIYFDVASQEKLINKFYDVIVNGGLFIVGHSESLLNKKHSFEHIAPTIYKK